MASDKKKTAMVVGMARSGIGSAKLLYNIGYTVIINDMKAHIDGLEEALEGIEYINKLGVPPTELLDGLDLIVLSPVIPIFAPFVKAAQVKGVEVIGEIELGYCNADKDSTFVCISGTNGKTTSTTLTGEMFKAEPKHTGATYILGNIGVPITEYAQRVKPGDVCVCETAALQLESIQHFHAHAAAMVNISEDHLNRFCGSMDMYIAAKCRIFENQTEADFAILNYDDPIVRDMARLTKAKIVYFSQNCELDGFATCVFVRNGKMVWRCDGKEIELINTSDLIIPGRHNIENAMCCAATALSLGVSPETVRSVLLSFKGVEHRIEFVCEKDGIQYYNDSKGTNPDSTIRAIEAMSRPTILLLGVGEYDKKSDFTPVFRAFGDTVKGVVASGINVPAISEAAERTGFRELVVENGGFEKMILKARDMAHEGYNILLSPAAASWGMFTDYEQRGRIFKEIVNSL